MPSFPPFGDPDNEQASASNLRSRDRAAPNQPGKTNQAADEYPTIDNRLSGIAQAAMHSIGADGIAFAYALNEQAIVCHVSCGQNAPPPGTPLHLNSGIGGRCYREAKAITCSDTESDERVNKTICRRLDVRSMFAVPLRSNSAIIGVAQAFYARPHGFSDAKVAELEGSAELFVSCLRPAVAAEEKTPSLLVNKDKPADRATLRQNVERWRLPPEIAPMPWAQRQQSAWWNRPGVLLIAIAAFFALLLVAWHQSAPQLSSAPGSEPAKHIEDAAPHTASNPASGTLAPLAKQALSGDADAQFLLARHYESGTGIRQSLPMAYSWYILAAEAGNSVARQAVRSLTPKLSAGEIAAIRRNVGNMYATGVGVRRRDYIAAYAWLSLAEAGGEPRAKKDLDYLAVAMTPQQIAAAKQRASGWLKRQGHPNPMPQRINNR